MIIAIDFDGTIVEHMYPDIGLAVPYAITSMKNLQKAGHQLILYTMRSGPELDEAVEYCKGLGVEFWGINNNPDQHTWSTSPKVYAHKYVDDAAIGCPLRNGIQGTRPMVNWEEVINLLS